MSSPTNVSTATPSDGGVVATGIVFGILAGIFIIMAILARYVRGSRSSAKQLADDEQRYLCKGCGSRNADDLEAGKRKRIASISKLDVVVPSRAFGEGNGEEGVRAQPRLSNSFDDVKIWYVFL
jgi:hypothetical protein